MHIHIQTIQNYPYVVRFLDNKLWVGMCHKVSIYKLNLKRIGKWKNIAQSCLSDVADVLDKSVVIVSISGLFHVNSKGKQISKIDSGKFNSGVYHNGTLYAYEINLNTIKTYAYNRSWNTTTTIPSPVMKDFITLSISNTAITICSENENKICTMNQAGNVLHIYGTSGSEAADELEYPSLCQEDDDGTLLVADYGNDRFQVRNKQGEWSIVIMEPAVKWPSWAAYVNGVVYVVSLDKNLYSYYAT